MFHLLTDSTHNGLQKGREHGEVRINVLWKVVVTPKTPPAILHCETQISLPSKRGRLGLPSNIAGFMLHCLFRISNY